MSERVQRFAALIREETGNALPASRLASLEVLLQRRAAAGGRSVERYLDDLAAGSLTGEWPLLVAEVTIKESSFFRAAQQFDAIVKQVLPPLLAARAAPRRLRVWSVACASGEEPATLAIMLAEQAGLQGWDWQVLATDLDTDALERARRGLHGERAVAGVPVALRQRWFSRRGALYELSPLLQERIVYRQLNLVRQPWALPDPRYDLILARNVLIYFRRALQRRVLSNLAGHLAADGALFLGASETLWQAQGELAVLDLGGVFCFRFPDQPPAAAPARAAVTPPASRKTPKPAAARARVEAAALAVQAAVDPPQASALAVASAALAARCFEAAEAAVLRALAETPQDAAAHAVQGLLCEVLGREAEAAAAYRAALYLEAGLFQVRAQLAESLVRQGHVERAEQQWREVLRDLASGRARALAGVDDLPWLDRERAARRARQALREVAQPGSAGR